MVEILTPPSNRPLGRPAFPASMETGTSSLGGGGQSGPGAQSATSPFSDPAPGSATVPGWIDSLTDAGIKADITVAVASGAVSYSGLLSVLRDVGATLSVGGASLSDSQFADLQTIAANLTNGLSTSSYVADVFDNLVNGNTGNVSFVGGGAVEGSLGNLHAGSTATQFSELMGKWFLGTDMPEPTNAWGVPDTYTQINAPLFSAGGASLNDVNQGALGDCYVLAALAEVANNDPNFISSMIVNNGNNTYGVRFYVNDHEEWVTVNDFIPTYTANGGQFVFNNSSAQGNIWVDLVEKAYVQLNAEGNLGRYTSENGYNSIWSGWPEQVLNQVTGTTTINYQASTDPSTLASIVSALNAGNDVVLCSYSNSYNSSGQLCLVGSHAMSVTGYDSVTGDLIIRNPWGVEPGQYWATTFEVSMSQLAAVGGDYFAVDSAGGMRSPPTVNITTTTLLAGVPMALSLLFTATNGGAAAAITNYKVQVSGGGAILLGGAVNLASAADAASGWVMISAADLAKVSLTGGGAGAETLTIMAEGIAGWSAAAAGTVTIATSAPSPSVIAGAGSVFEGQATAVSALFTAVDAAGKADISAYKLAQFALGRSGRISH